MPIFNNLRIFNYGKICEVFRKFELVTDLSLNPSSPFRYGAEIKAIHYISRDEPVHSFYENADFSPKAIKDSIKEGELKTTQILDEVPKTE